MKAAVLERRGAHPKFRIEELPRPTIGIGQVLVKNRASSVNPVDTILQQGKSLLVSIGFERQVIGSDFCGVVIASKSRLFKEGDELFGLIPAIRGGAYAEEIVVDERWAVPKPGNISYLEAGVMPLVGLTAYQSLFHDGQLRRGDNVLITGCTGGVGSAAVLLAKETGAHITGICRDRHRAYANEIGCDVVIDYETQQIPADAKFDLIVDAAGKYTYSSLAHHLSHYARFVTTRGDTDKLKGMVRTAVDLVLEKRMKVVMVRPDANDLQYIKGQVERGRFKLSLAATFPLEGLTEAFEMMKTGGFVGKIAVSIP